MILKNHFETTPFELDDSGYTRDFEATWRDVNEGGKKLLEYILESQKWQWD